jgi:acyl-CoA dehydrogenase
MTYRAPVDALRHSLAAIGGLDSDDVEPILREAARFAEERLAPENRRGDVQGSRFADGRVTTPDGWPAIYRDWAAGGWNGVDLPADHGGMGLSTRLATATMEIWTSACMAFSLGPVLTQGAVDALELHGSPALQAAYMPKLASGEWTATMNLTEPQAGSDLGLLRTRAEPSGDGTYRLTGSKIFITCGEHDLTEQIVHLVLARLPDALAGTRGISLFLVPKLMPDGSRNGVHCTGIEHKLGIHASPTCSMSYEGAVGWLVGEENKGLACMFTMMNKARLYTGLQGVAVAELACQQAEAFAAQRRQGRAEGVQGPAAIDNHPDVRRMLAGMRARTSAARAIAHAAAEAIDLARTGDAGWIERAGFLTPVVKAFGSEMGCEVSSLNVQVHGGMGYVEETGAAQLFRDARITPIYEGTNGIQAIDFLTRKMLRPGSRLAATYAEEFGAIAASTRAAGLASTGEIVAETAESFAAATAWARRHANDSGRLLFSATPMLRLFSLAAGAALLAKGAIAPGGGALVPEARFFAENIAVEAMAQARVVMNAEPV